MALVKIMFTEIFQLAVKISGDTLTLDFVFSLMDILKRIQKEGFVRT